MVVALLFATITTLGWGCVANSSLFREAVAGEARERDAAPSLAHRVAIETVGAVSERDAGAGIGPSDLSARAAVPECVRGVGFSEAAIIRLAITTRDHHAQRAITGDAKNR